MNKLIKFLVAVLGACSVVFDIVTPIVLVLFLVTTVSSLTPFYLNALIIAGLFASLYRGIKFCINVNG